MNEKTLQNKHLEIASYYGSVCYVKSECGAILAKGEISSNDNSLLKELNRREKNYFKFIDQLKSDIKNLEL